jgi:hypothetical protein
VRLASLTPRLTALAAIAAAKLEQGEHPCGGAVIAEIQREYRADPVRYSS